METNAHVKNLTRKILLNIAVRRAKSGSGSSKQFLMKRTTVMKWLDFTPIFGRIKWAVVGAVATRHYMPERNTQDMDIIVSALVAKKVREKLIHAGFKYQSELFIGGASWISPNRKSIDVLEGNQEWLDEALTQAKNNKDKQGLLILPFEYLILMKYQASRVQDLADISRMLGQANEQMLSVTKKLFNLYEPYSLKDLENLIVLGKLEMN